MTPESAYIRGTHPEDQSRLSLLNDLTNTSFLDFLDIRPGDSVLEVGSGLGILAHRVATAFPDSQVTGVEIAAEQIDKARADFSETPNLKFIEGDALSLDLQESLFKGEPLWVGLFLLESSLSDQALTT
jgi:ubiquinone/menaquinone biosynthesis C-methylase UbiE